MKVRARVMASLNGRTPQLLIDPTTDLAKVRRSLAPAPWILPLTRAAETSGRGARGPDAARFRRVMRAI